MKKVWDFFKSTLGIVILVLVIIAIIVIYLNWDAIKAWWSNEETDINGTEGGTRLGSTSSTRQKCVSLGGDGCSYLGLYVQCSECSKRNIPIT